MATPDFIKAPLALFKAIFLPHPKARPVDLSGKVIVVTGATPGSIGYESAKTFANWGAQVCVTARSAQSVEVCLQQFQNDLPEALKKNICVKQMDLQSSQSVSEFVSWFNSKYQQLDVLLNNAGIYLDMLGQWTQEKQSEDGFEIHWRVNYLGSMQLTCELLPLLKKTANKSGEVRVIMVTSHMHDNCRNEEMFEGLKPYKSVKAYGRSKLALNHFAVHLHQKLHEQHKVKFICVHPGSIYTNLVSKGLEENPAVLALREKLAWIEKIILLSPQQGAQTQIMCATDSQIQSGGYYYRCARAAFAPTLKDRSAAEKLWQQSKEWLKSIQVDVEV